MNSSSNFVTIPPSASASFVKEFESVRQVRPTIDHWQLRDLLQVDEESGCLYYVSAMCVMMFDPNTQMTDEIMHCEFTPVSIALDSSSGFIAIGGMNSELLLFDTHERRIVYDHPLYAAINNGLCFARCGGRLTLFVCNNDETIRMFDAPSMVLRSQVHLHVPINYCRVSPDNTHLIAVGDGRDVYLFNVERTLERVFSFVNVFSDSAFAASWSPSCYSVACGSQLSEVCILDIRNLTVQTRFSCGVQGSVLSACRSMKWSHVDDIDLLAVAQHTSTFHVYDVRRGFTEVQEVQNPASGEIAGIAFSAQCERLYVAHQRCLRCYSVDLLGRRQCPSFEIL